MNEKKNNGFAALILSLVVVVAAVFVVKFAGGSAKLPVTPVVPGPDQGSDESQAPASKYVAGTYTATARGYAGDVTAKVTIDENDMIVEVVLEGPSETPALGGVAMEKLPAKIIAAQSAEVDVVASATYTSKGALAAIADCLAQAVNNGGTAEGGEVAGAYKPGTYEASARGYAGEVTAKITIGEDGAIAEVVLEGPSETPALGGVAMEKLPAKIIAAQSAEVDVVASATYTSKGALAAIADCLAQAAN